MNNSNKDKALAALLSCRTQQEAAAQAGIAERTLRGYLEDPSFCAEYERRRRKLVDEAAATIQKSLQAAIHSLNKIVNDGKDKRAVVAASRTLLEYGLRYTEISDICRRLEDIEQIVRGRIIQ